MKASLFIAIATLLVGCSGAPSPMVGTWNGQVKDSSVPAAVFDFHRNGTFVARLAGPTAKVEGTYTLDGRKLTLDAEKNDGKPTDDPNITCTLSDDLKTFTMDDAPITVRFVKE